MKKGAAPESRSSSPCGPRDLLFMGVRLVELSDFEDVGSVCHVGLLAEEAGVTAFAHTGRSHAAKLKAVFLRFVHKAR